MNFNKCLAELTSACRNDLDFRDIGLRQLKKV